jgi:hypothetical protein
MVQEKITSHVNARIGLLGNPSDSYFGKTISLSLANFCAEVTCSDLNIFRTLIYDQHNLSKAP